jgi:hypothetical protein
MSRELIVGPDATNATEQLDDLVGDDILFDRLSDLASRDASANVWDDTDVQARLAELGIQLPANAPADAPADPAAEPAVDPAAQPVQQPPVAEGVDDLKNIDPGELAGSTLGSIAGYMAGDALGGPMVGFGAAGVGSAVGGALAKEGALSDLPRPNKRNQFRSLHKLRKQRGLGEQGVSEGAKEDMSKEVKAMATGTCPHCHGPVKKKEHPTLTQYHCAKCGIRASQDKPGVAEGEANAGETLRSQIIKLYKRGLEDYDIAYDLDIDEKIVADIIDDYDRKQQQRRAKQQGMTEASGCNHTMEGEMCPEHGLAECGVHESQVAESQEGDALLARIKSLALLR